MKKQILIIEDDSSVRFLLGLFLKEYFDVVVKADGLEGMLWLDSGNIPDLVMADIDMPRLNGYEFIKNIRKSGFYRDIPIIMLSGWDSEEARERCFKEGANLFMVKPFNPSDLLANINKLLADNKEIKYAL
jgi:two-component system, chemotaxis family, chemotaxis protein CheY